MTITSRFSEFQKWTSNRNVPSLGTNDGATSIAFQKWHHFKEAFAPELIATAVQESGRDVRACIDPFGGSGTTALACQMLGIDSTTIEVNPFLADAIKAKLTRYDSDAVVRALANVRRRAKRHPVDPYIYFENVPKTFLEPGVKERWLFDANVAAKLAAILSAIETVEDGDISRLFRVLVGGILADVSNVLVSGKGRRYRKNWNQTPIDAGQVEQLFAERAETAILEIQEFRFRPEAAFRVIHGDARTFQPDTQYDLSVFSPPYPNSFDYTDVYNLELWMLGYLSHYAANQELRRTTLASHVQVTRDYPSAPEDSATLISVTSELRDARASLWDPWIPEMIGAYFSDLETVIHRIVSSLADAGQCWMVVGDSRYAGVRVPVAQIIEELSENRGWIIDRSEPIRHMRSSVQQGWRPELAETLIVLHAKS